MRATTTCAILVMSLFLTACTHSIAVSSRPPGATAQLEEVGGDKLFQLGQTPAKRDVIATGAYMLTLTKQGYSDYRKKIMLGDQPSYDVELVPVYHLSIETEPEGARLVLEDKGTGGRYSIGMSPARYTVEGRGPFSVTASMQGFETTTVPIETTEGVSDVLKTFVLKQLQPGASEKDQPVSPDAPPNQ